VVVTCDPRDLASDAPRDYLEHPVLIVEVLSESTEAADRHSKWLNYQKLESLQEYVLVDQKQRWVELYRKTDAGWLQEMRVFKHDVVELKSVGLQLPVAQIYESVDLPEFEGVQDPGFGSGPVT
jgi:Uma2 family endonuclease